MAAIGLPFQSRLATSYGDRAFTLLSPFQCLTSIQFANKHKIRPWDKSKPPGAGVAFDRNDWRAGGITLHMRHFRCFAYRLVSYSGTDNACCSRGMGVPLMCPAILPKSGGG